jgi:hypothetical protein
MKALALSCMFLFSSLVLAQTPSSHYNDIRSEFINQGAIPNISVINKLWTGYCYDKDDVISPAASAFSVNSNNNVIVGAGDGIGERWDFFVGTTLDSLRNEITENEEWMLLSSNGVIWYVDNNGLKISFKEFYKDGRQYLLVTVVDQGVMQYTCSLLAK